MISLLLLAGCSLTPHYQRPQTDVPASWSMTSHPEASPVSAQWWDEFDSAELDGLIATALAKNHDVKGSLARIEQARAGLKSARSTLFPSLSLSGSTARTESDGTSGDNWRAGASLSYDLDLFGSARASSDAAAARLESNIYAHEAVKLALMADTATAYFTLLGGQERLRIASDNLRIAEDTLRMIEARFRAGADSALEVAQQKSAVASAQASRASLEAAIRTTETALSVLLGQPPQSRPNFDGRLDALRVPVIDAGVPSYLLERRPDIRSAEANLLAANADLGAARAALYPNVTLGLDWTAAASAWGNPATTALALASSLSQPIFAGGRLQAGVEQAAARRTELLETYRQTILTSFKEVEDALSDIRAAQVRAEALKTAEKEAETAFALAQTRYKAGAIDFQTLLNTEAQLFQARDASLQSQQNRLAAAVTLYRSLGGGWTDAPSPAGDKS